MVSLFLGKELWELRPQSKVLQGKQVFLRQNQE